MPLATLALDVTWLAEFAGVVRSYDLRTAPDVANCIGVSRFGIDVLARLGIEAEPLSVQAIFLDRTAAAMARDHRLPRDAWPPEAGWVAAENTGWSAAPEIWDGHLVLRLAPQPRLDLRASVIVDLSADQFHRPELGLHLTHPVIAEIGSGWSDRRPVTVPIGDNRLEFRPSERDDYRWHPAWASREEWVHDELELLLAERGLV